MENIDFVRQCVQSKKFRTPGFREALIALRFEAFSEGDAAFFQGTYFTIKGDADRTSDRGILLQAMVLQCLQYDLKEFFLTVFKKERALSTQCTAIRGYASYATETEVIPVMARFCKKLEQASPWNYTEYEEIRSKFGLPYLVNRYGYDCFRKAMEQLDKKYDAMPGDLKGYFTLGENGMHVQLLSADETRKKFEAFLLRDEIEKLKG